MIPAGTLRAWRRTAYAVGPHVVRIGRRSPGLDGLLREVGVRQAAIVSADNPLGRRRSPGANRASRRRLREASRRWPCWAGQGRGRGWTEDHLLIAADPRVADRLARQQLQLGYVLLRRGQPARLVLACGVRVSPVVPPVSEAAWWSPAARSRG